LKKLLASLLVFVLILNGGIAASAKSEKNDALALEEEVQLLSTFISSENGKLVFDEKGAKKSKLSKETIKQVKTDFEAANKVIEEMQNNEEVSIASSCKGSNKYVDRWFGSSLYMDSCKTTELIGLLTVSAGVTTIAGTVASFTALPVGVSLLISAGLQGIRLGVLTYASSKGCGVYVNFAFDYVPMGAFSQC
jgi:hypothetical protein